eukprot:scaffold9498_cov79-Phaeocystis_antarctica.AAC.4
MLASRGPGLPHRIGRARTRCPAEAVAFHPREGGNDAALDAVGLATARVRVHELAVRPEEGGGLGLSTGHACQQRPWPSAPDRAGAMLRSTQWAKPPLAHASTSLRDRRAAGLAATSSTAASRTKKKEAGRGDL